MHQTIQDILATYTPKPMGEKRTYAVLLPLVQDNGEWRVLYEVRSEQISQPGEVSFPGGRIEPGETPQKAAIRETIEELNVDPNAITVLGEIDYIVQERRTIHCFVGQLDLDWRTITPNEEVARLFTIPLDLLLEHGPTYFQLTSTMTPEQDFPFERIPNGERYSFSPSKRMIPFYDWDDETLWGLTAQFTHRFTELLHEHQVTLGLNNLQVNEPNQ